MKTRYPAAIGFYPGNKDRLIQSIENCLKKALGSRPFPSIGDNAPRPRRILGGISPHAGYVYSGSTAAKLMAEIASDGQPETFILIGLLHHGFPLQVIMSEGIWKTPLGDCPIDNELAASILKASAILVDDDKPHKNEHSIEVQLPFLQYLFGQPKIVPIALGLSDYENLVDVAEAVRSGVEASKRDVVILASTDMTHYGYDFGYAPLGHESIDEVLEFMRKSDGENIQHIEAFAPKKLLQNVREKGITMCGVAPVVATLIATQELGANKVESLEYTTSYDVEPRSSAHIVGYYSAKITK